MMLDWVTAKLPFWASGHLSDGQIMSFDRNGEVKYSIDQSGLVFNRHFVFLHGQYGLGGMSKARHPDICLGKLGHALWRLLPGFVFVHQQS